MKVEEMKFWLERMNEQQEAQKREMEKNNGR